MQLNPLTLTHANIGRIAVINDVQKLSFDSTVLENDVSLEPLHKAEQELRH